MTASARRVEDLQIAWVFLRPIWNVDRPISQLFRTETLFMLDCAVVLGRLLAFVQKDFAGATDQVAAFVHDPRFKEPWVLVTSLQLSAIIVWRLYCDRWPIEQVPLIAKQMLGGARQFVSAPESCQRLPELTLLGSEMLTYLAATLPAIPTGFWDRNPKPTAGRRRRMLAKTPFPNSYALPGRFRKKASVMGHLPKGILGHRRLKKTETA